MAEIKNFFMQVSDFLMFIYDALSVVVFNFNDHTYTIGTLLVVPIWLITSIIITKFVLRRIRTVLNHRNKDPNFIQLMERLTIVLSTIIIFFTTLSFMQVSLTAFAFLSGTIAIGLGFGAQNIINNFISGWILIGEKPIRIGDFLEVENAKGVVEQINTRSTRIRRVDGVHLLVPNSKLIENTVINWTLRDRMVRGKIFVGVAYGSPCKKVAEILLQITKAQSEVLEDPRPAVFFKDFGDNSLLFEVSFWIHSKVEGGLKHVSSDIRFEIDDVFKEHGIEIAFPQRDLHVDGSLTINKPIEESR
ncbi:MAG: mechanosensitive ion channel family protein [Colwellia sp.]